MNNIQLNGLQASELVSMLQDEVQKQNKKLSRKNLSQWERNRIEGRLVFLGSILQQVKPVADEAINNLLSQLA